MSLSRRDILLAGLSLAVTGCATTSPTSRGGGRPKPIWPETVTRPTTPAPGSSAAAAKRPIHRATGLPAKPTPTTPGLPAGVLPRSRWTRHGLAGRNINRMNGVKTITLHHEGWTPFTATSAAASEDRIEQIRQIHTRDRGWADLGYHFVIDRQGRVYQGRSVTFQGAHVSDNNPHNLGIMMLGNFEQQKPTREQVDAMSRFTRQMMAAYGVPGSRVQTHREIKPTACPGRYMQAHVDRLRSRGVLS
ncbi:MAG: peptidoglycan recognition family protein [Planctomycetota bacterium]